MIWRQFRSRFGRMRKSIRGSSRTCWGPSWKARKDAVRIKQQSLVSHTPPPAPVPEKLLGVESTHGNHRSMELVQVRLGVTILRIVVLCLAPLLVASGVPAQRSPLPTEAGLMEITERGRMLAEYDAASWHSTDAVLALKSEMGKDGHYVARKVDAKWVVVYGRLNETRDKFLITYEATAAKTPEQFNVKKYDPPQEDTAFYLSAARAIDTALAAFAGEKRPYNAAVLPAKSGQLYVYIYPARTVADVSPIGGD